jgi:putative transcriptional regulator
MTIQGTSEYAHGLEDDGLLAIVNGEYRATKKGVEFLHDRLQELRRFVERASKEMAFVDTTAAIAATIIHEGARVGLFMENGVLAAHEGRSSPSSGIAVHDAAKGQLIAVRDLEGIVGLRPGRIILARIRSGVGTRRALPPTSKQALRRSKDFVVAALDAAGLVVARDLGLKPRIEFGVLGATIEAAERGVNVLLLLPEERVAEAVQAIEAANGKLEDKIPYESVALN